MWPWKKRSQPDALSKTFAELQANFLAKEADPGFLRRLAASMEKSPEPYEWILMVLARRLALLERSQPVTADTLVGVAIRQAEIRAEVRLLRSLSKMALQASAALTRQQALSAADFEVAETANN